MNMPLVLLNRRRRGFTAFSPSTLFALAEPGVWYDPSDLTTLYQDPAGTTPVTTPGQTVGLMLDKSKGPPGPQLVTNGTFDGGLTGWTAAVGGGNLPTLSLSSNRLRIAANENGQAASAYASITTVVGRTYLVSAQRFAVTPNSSIMTFAASTSTATSTANFLGQTGASGDTCIFVATGTTTYLHARISGTVGAGDTWEVDNISVRELPGNHATQATLASRPIYGIEPVGGRRNLLLATDTLATQSLTVAAVAHTLAFTGTGTVTLTGASIAGPLIGTGASNRVSLTFTPTAASLTLTVVGSVTLGQLELGSSVTAYQRTTTQYDVTEAGVASTSYLAFDGVDDGMVTGTITPGVDKAQVFAGVRKLSDAASGSIVELGSPGISTGNFWLANLGPTDAAASGFPSSSNYEFQLRGASTYAGRAATPFVAPITSVLSVEYDIGAAGVLNEVKPKVNGTVPTLTTNTGRTDAGSGSFSNLPMYIGRRTGTTSPFKGNVYSLITRFGANLDAGVITNTETWVAGKTGISL